MLIQHVSPNFGPGHHAYAFGFEVGVWRAPNRDLITWVTNALGEGVDIHEVDYDTFMRARWCYSSRSGYFWFHNGDDALAFKMRWC